MTNQIFERRFAIECSRQDNKSVEPATSLIDALGNKITRETLLELLLVFEWVVILSIWHTATFKPTVKDFGDSSQNCARLDYRRYGQMINTVDKNWTITGRDILRLTKLKLLHITQTDIL